MKFCCSTLMFIGRLCIAVIFLLAGVGKFMDIEGTMHYMASKHVGYLPYTLYAAAIIEILGALSLILGFKTRFGALILALFLIPVTYMMHDFWNITEPLDRVVQMTNFLKNTAIFGGLLYVMAAGSGGCACDRCCSGTCATNKP